MIHKLNRLWRKLRRRTWKQMHSEQGKTIRRLRSENTHLRAILAEIRELDNYPTEE